VSRYQNITILDFTGATGRRNWWWQLEL